MNPLNRETVAQTIDHTVLKPDASPSDIDKLCHEAIEEHFAAVCVNPCYVPRAANILKSSTVRVATVIGFPLGANQSAIKLAESEQAITDGANEIDMVINLGAAKAGNWLSVQKEIALLATSCHGRGAQLKVILETCLLTKEEIRQGCAAAIAAKADFVKTSTGFSSGGATIEDVKLMSSLAAPHGLGVKAAGGIRDAATALQMIAAGATRIGTSSGTTIVSELPK